VADLEIAAEDEGGWQQQSERGVDSGIPHGGLSGSEVRSTDSQCRVVAVGSHAEQRGDTEEQSQHPGGGQADGHLRDRRGHQVVRSLGYEQTQNALDLQGCGSSERCGRKPLNPRSSQLCQTR
jgi:hypothetical protein